MQIELKSKIISISELKTRPSKLPNYELENSAIRNLSSQFTHTLEIALSSLLEIILQTSHSDFSGIHLSSLTEDLLSERAPSNILEIIEIEFKLSGEDFGSFWVGRNETNNKYDYEDYRILESIGEIASSFILNHLVIKLERDNLERVFNSTPSASAIWRGENLIFDRVNDAYQSLFPDLELVGKPFEEALPPRIVRDYPDLFKDILKTGKPFSILEQYTPVQHYSGGPLEDHYYDVNFVQLKNKDGSSYGVYQHTVDITAQVEARKRLEGETNKLEAIFNDSPAAFAMFRGKDMVFEKVNHLWTELVGPREYIGKAYRDVYHEFSNSGILEMIQYVFNSGETYRIKEKELQVDVGNGNTETRFYDFTFVRVLDSEGKPYGVFGHASNVTENIKLNEILKSALQARDVFTRIASHELNTPLTSLKLLAQMRKKQLLKNPDEHLTVEKSLKFVDHTLSLVQRLTLLVSDMLDVGRINSGRFKMYKSKANLTDILNASIARFGPQLESIGCKLLSHVENNIVLNLDPQRIDQVTTHILNNAIKYAGKGKVDISLIKQDGFAVVSVKDEGQGIAPEDQLRIFERFERATSEMNVSGLGFGLFISKQIISAHDGIIGVNSEKGKGAEFYYKIPLNP